jgi:hypothetical protein
MAEGFPGQEHEIQQAAPPEGIDEQFYVDTFGLTTADTSRIITYPGKEPMTVAQLLTQKPDGCPIDFATIMSAAHKEDPEQGVKREFDTLVRYGATISEPQAAPQPSEADPKKKLKNRIRTLRQRRAS